MPPFLTKYWPLLAAAALFAALLTLAFCQGKQSGKSSEVIKQQGREIETQQDLGEANSNAADARVNDAVRTARERKELDDATKATQDPDRQRALRGCVILRQQGRDTANIPECRGS